MLYTPLHLSEMIIPATMPHPCDIPKPSAADSSTGFLQKYRETQKQHSWVSCGRENIGMLAASHTIFFFFKPCSYFPIAFCTQRLDTLGAAIIGWLMRIYRESVQEEIAKGDLRTATLLWLLY